MAAIPITSEADWHALRAANIGGSEVVSLFYVWRQPNGAETIRHMFEAPGPDEICLGCLGTYKTGYRLWLEKAGKLAPDNDENERLIAGQCLEPAIAQFAQIKWPEWKLRKVRRYLTHPAVEGWGATLDYEVLAPTFPPAEFKNVDRMIFLRDWLADGDEIVTPPMHINLQLQHQIGVGKADHGWIVPLVGGNELKRGRIDRHEPTQARIGEAISLFWQSVKQGIAPAHLADAESVAEEYAFGGSSDAKLDLSGDAFFAAQCARYRRWKDHADFVDQQLSLIKGRITKRIGEATKATTIGWKVSWPAIHIPAKDVPAKHQAERNYRGGLTVTKEK
jgi:predicted phage-related endonuclease